ncbi:COG4223 family protein [Pseudorhodobacter sp.]|uniref:COG4223 family protein n=1 Tax=Pseudorhodobacter sp. TaxID=1934400 RepID=UPI002647805D|nr:hypothetical protein [Pseudorhodobacter sp.]MDN5785993.1 hypothetical protein [Pseudorhodobacter sp.]
MATRKTSRSGAEKAGSDAKAAPRNTKKPDAVIEDAVVLASPPAKPAGSLTSPPPPQPDAGTKAGDPAPTPKSDPTIPFAKADTEPATATAMPDAKPSTPARAKPDEVRAGEVKRDSATPISSSEPKPDTAKLDAPKPKAPEKTQAPPPAPVIVKRGPGFGALVLGGALAAVLGFAVAQFVKPEGWPFPANDQLDAKLTAQSKAIDDLRAQLLALPKEDVKGPTAEDLAAISDTANHALQTAEAAKAAADAPSEDVAPRITALEDRIGALEARPTGDGGVDSAALTALSGKIAALRTELEAQKATAQAQEKATEVQSEKATQAAQKTLLQADLAKVEAAIQSGASYTEPLASLTAAGLNIPAVLTENAETGVPTAADLATALEDPAREALSVSVRGNMGSTWTERAGAFLRSQTGARSLTPRAGDDPDAVLSRVNADAIAGNFEKALGEVAALPEAAQTVLGDWVARVKLRLNAEQATAAISAALSER